MHLTSALYIALFEATLAHSASAMPEGVVGMGFRTVRNSIDTSSQKLGRGSYKRDSTGALALDNGITQYIAKLQIGTPSQEIDVILDTGSSDLWVMAADNPYCSGVNSNIPPQQQIECKGVTTFNPKDSSSFHANESASFAISYGDTSMAQGEFGQDTIKVGDDISIDSANFAVASAANTSAAVFGIGPRFGESTAHNVNPSGDIYPTYDNLLASMKNQGKISSLSFSLWLNKMDAQEGQILFGGVDHSKYNNQLTLMPILRSLPTSQGNVELKQAQSVAVQMTGVGLYSGDSSSLCATGGVSALLDSGTSLSYLPSEWVAAIGNSLGAIYSDTVGMYIIDCESSSGIVVELAGTQFQVPLSQMALPLTESTPQGVRNATDQNGNPICGLGIQPGGGYSDGPTFILGDTFLRGVYVAYDYENWEVGIAPAKYDGGDSNIEAIGSSGIPSGTSASGYSSTDFVSNFGTSAVNVQNTKVSIDGGRTYAANTSGGPGGNPDGGIPGDGNPPATRGSLTDAQTGGAGGGAGGGSSGSAGGQTSAGGSSSSSKNSATRGRPSILTQMFIYAISYLA